MFFLSLLATQSVNASQCDLSPRPGQMPGGVIGISCTNLSLADMTIGQCALQCHSLDNCRVSYMTCEESICQCFLCQGVHKILFNRPSDTLQLNGNMVATNKPLPPNRKWSIPGGGLSVGRVIMIRLILSSEKTALYLAGSGTDVALVIRFNVINKKNHAQQQYKQ
ncbi:hypothetical protein ElyMa_000690000 [Elysia marginata]|uniref:Uncharacterized protein n=1 Tax=Elysia marginata TaxID=1093978 RepID=A0AAV4GJP8_9GAST|nr:hypothetical protein ElyMa_000690000 [Elysia marginata]